MEGDPNVGSSSSSANKKRNRTSKVWDEMTEVNRGGKVKAACKHCKKEFPADSKDGTTRLWNHLHRCRNNPKRKGPGGRDRDDQHQSLSPSIKTKELASLIKEKSVWGLIKHFSSIEGDTSDEECEDWPDLDPLSVLNSRKDEILQLYQEEKEKLCQFLNNLSCLFTLQLVFDCSRCFLVLYYIDDSWERQSKIISFWHCPRENLTEAVKQSCMDWKIDTNICSVVLSLPIDTADGLDNEIGKMESWFSQRRSLPFAGCLPNTYYLWHYVDSVLKSEDYFTDGIKSLKECAAYVHNQSTSDKLIPLDSAQERAISLLKYGPSGTPFWGFFFYFESAVRVKEVFSALEQFDSEFRSINLRKQKWDEVTATFEHLKFLYHVTNSFTWWTCDRTCDIPIIVDLPYVHKVLTDRCNHAIEDCLFCQKVMKRAIIDLFFSEHYSVRVIAVILDPRLKMDGVRLHYKEIYGSDADRYIEKVNKNFRDVYDAYAATDSSSSKSYRMLDATSSLYMKELKVPAVEQFNILAWWRGNAPFYPTLARMARDYLALEEPYNNRYDKGALTNLLRDIRDINYKFEFCDLPDIITPLLCLKGFLGSAEN